MYDQADTTCFEYSNPMPEQASIDTTRVTGLVEESGISHEISPPFTPLLDHLHHHDHSPLNNPTNHNQEMDPTMEEVLHSTQNPNLGIFNNSLTTPENNCAPPNVVPEMGFAHYNHHEHEQVPTSTTDLLTLLHLPRYSPSLGKSSLSPSTLGFLGELNPDHNPSGSGSNTMSYDPTAAATMPYDPLFHLNLPPQPSPLLRDLMFQTFPIGYDGNGNNSLFGRMEEGEGDIVNGVAGITLHDNGDHHHNINPNGIFEFTNGNNASCLGEGKEGKCPKNFVTERERRANFNDKYKHLQRLVPNPTKPDRASIVKDAIDYIQELKRTVGELKLLVEKKRISKERAKRLKTDNQDTTSTTPTNAAYPTADDKAQGVDGSSSGVVKPDPDEGFNGSAETQLRSSWLQRKCKDTEVDVRIVDDDVTIKLVQRKKINCLLPVSRTLDELQMDLLHVAGGHVGDYYSYLFNTKICEGSSVYASAIANKLIEVVERQHAAAAASVAIPQTCSF